MLPILANFFAPAEGSIRGLLNAAELYRSFLTALGSSSIVGLLLAVVQAVLSNATTIFPDPMVASLATALLTLVVDLLRRQNQGPTPAPIPAPIPNPAPSAA